MKKTTKSDRFEILSVKAAKTECDITEVEIRIPGFQNFGAGLADRERQAAEHEKKLEAGRTPAERAKKEAEWAKEEAEGDAFLKGLAGSLRSAVAESKKEVEKNPQDEEVAMANSLIQGMELLAESLENGPDDPDPHNEPAKEKKSSPELFRVLPQTGMKWDKAAESRIDELIRDWPRRRPEILKAAHKYYQELYPELKETFGDMTEFNFIMPKPTSPKAIEDIFSIQTIHLHADGTVGLSGSCTWDDEHGFGALIKNGRVVTFGHADEAG